MLYPKLLLVWKLLQHPYVKIGKKLVTARSRQFGTLSAFCINMPFRDRTEAGECLAVKLAAYANRQDTLVLGLPRGGEGSQRSTRYFYRAQARRAGT